MSKTLKGFKSRVHSSVGKSIRIEVNEKGSYALFYFIGRSIQKKFKSSPTKKLNKDLIDYLRDNQVVTIVKAGTTANRQCFNDPYDLRLGEIQSSLGKLFNGKHDASDRATKKAYEMLVSDDRSSCFMVMIALDTYSEYENTAWIEEEVKTYINDTYGLLVGNDPSVRVTPDRSRWGTKRLALEIEDSP